MGGLGSRGEVELMQGRCRKLAAHPQPPEKGVLIIPLCTDEKSETTERLRHLLNATQSMAAPELEPRAVWLECTRDVKGERAPYSTGYYTRRWRSEGRPGAEGGCHRAPDGQSPDFQQQGVKRKEFLLNPQRPRKRLCWNSLFLKLPF